jgi:hypothetical protein
MQTASKRRENVISNKQNPKASGSAILTCDNADFKPK